jgi:hypothetical protein
MAIVLEIEIPVLELEGREAEASYAMVQALEDSPMPEAKPPPKPAESDSEEEEEPPVFGWEEPEVEAPKELLELWRRAQDGDHRIEVKKLLDSNARFKGLPTRSPENNMRADSKNRTDKFLRVVQQNLLNFLRVQGHQLQAPKLEVQLQLWQYVAELYQKILIERKDLSLPGCTKEQQDHLFTKEDVSHVKNDQSINSISMGVNASPSLGHRFRFSFTGSSFKGGWKGGKGFRFASGGKSYGYNSHWGYGKGAPKGGFKGGFRRGKGQGVPRIQPRRLHHLPSLLQAKAATAVVGEEWASKHCSFDPARCVPRLALPCFAHHSSSKELGGSEKGIVHFTGVLPSGCSSGSFSRRHSVSSALVCHHKVGAQWQGKTAFNFRLQTFKCLSQSQALSVRKLDRHFSSLEEGHVGSKSRPQKCLLPFGTFRQNKAICQDAGGEQVVPDECSLFRIEHSASTLDASHECFSENVEKEGFVGLHLSGRHPFVGTKSKVGECPTLYSAHRFAGKWDVCKLGKIQHRSYPKLSTFGLHSGFEGGFVAGALSKTEIGPERIGQICDPKTNVLQKDGCYSRSGQKFPDSFTFLKSFHRSVDPICAAKPHSGLGFHVDDPPP